MYEITCHLTFDPKNLSQIDSIEVQLTATSVTRIHAENF